MTIEIYADEVKQAARILDTTGAQFATDSPPIASGNVGFCTDVVITAWAERTDTEAKALAVWTTQLAEKLQQSADVIERTDTECAVAAGSIWRGNQS